MGMANFKTVQGILALIDIVDFTKQAGDLGDNYTTQYTKYFQNKIKEIAARWKFQVIKFIGDAALLFGTEPEGILDIMLDLFERDKPEDKYGFRSRFRIVAHSSYFQFQMKGKTLTDVVGVEAIKMFRMEKYANARELLITDSLYPGIQSLLTAKNIQASRRPLEEPLKGFEDGAWFPTFYKLTAAEKVTGPANLLEQRMNELEQEVQMIPVFGNMYPPVPMDNNFINLALLCDEKEPIRSRRKKHRTRLQETGKEEPDMEKWDARDDWMLKEQERTGREDAQRYEEITVEVLYKNKNRCYTSGIIVGLPGAGKTTILRHLAYKEFRANRRRKPGRKKIVLFVPCRDILFYDDWYKKEYGGTVSIEKNAALEYMTRVFLLGSKPDEQLSPEEKVEFRNGVNKVKKTFEENRLTLLVDALDEAPDNESKDRIRDLFLALASKNRLFLTSRPSERVHVSCACLL